MFLHKTFTFSILLFALQIIAQPLTAQNTYSWSAEAQFGRVFAHIPTIQNVASSRPVTLQLRYSQNLGDSAFCSLFHIRLQRGYLLNITDFNMQRLGYMVAAGYYLQPTLAIGKKLKLCFTPAFGLSFNSNPYDEFTNRTNFTYATHVNLYASVGFHTKFNLTENMQLNCMFQLNHFSNGAMIKPNSGVNWISSGVGLEYQLPHKKPAPSWLPAKRNRKSTYHLDITPYFTKSKRDTVTARWFMNTGFAAQIIRRGLLHGYTIGYELAYDEMYVVEAKRKGKTVVTPWLPAVFIGHEFLLGKVIFTQQFGMYAKNIHTAYIADWYHRWGLSYYPIPKVGFGFSFKIHDFRAEFVDARVTYRIF